MNASSAHLAFSIYRIQAPLPGNVLTHNSEGPSHITVINNNMIIPHRPAQRSVSQVILGSYGFYEYWILEVWKMDFSLRHLRIS